MNKKIVFFLVMAILILTKANLISSQQTPTNVAEIMSLDKSIVGSGIEYSKLENNGARLVFSEKNSNLIIEKNKFENIIPQSESGNPTYIDLDNKGNIVKADLTASKLTTFVFNEKEYTIPANSRIIYEKGNAKIIGKKGDMVTLSQSFQDEKGIISKNSMNLELTGGRINIENVGKDFILSGKNFKLNGNEINGLGKDFGKISVSSGGEINKIWKGTEANILGIKHRTFQENLNIYYNENINIPQHKGENYFSYGDGKVWMGGKGYQTIFKNGNPIIGKDVSEQFFVSVDMKGGEAHIDKSGIYVDKSPLEIINGRNSVDYYNENGKTQYKLKLDDCLSKETCTPLGGLNFKDGGLIKYNKEGIPFKIEDLSRTYNHNDRVTFNIEKGDTRTYSLDQNKLYILAKRGDTGGNLASLGMGDSSEWGHAGVMIYDYNNKEWIISEVVAKGVQNVKDIRRTYFTAIKQGGPKLDGVYEVQTEIDPDKALEFARKGEGSPFGAYPPWVYKLHSSFTGENKMRYICSEWANQVVISGSPISESLDTSIGVSKGSSSYPVTIVQNVFLKAPGYTIAKELADSKNVKEVLPIVNKN
jgi:hypothetical protein